MSTLATNAITDASGGNTATINTFTPTVSNMAGRNKIINGAMVFDQRNAGAAVTTNGAFPVDRFNVNNTSDGSFSAQQSSTVPAGFSKSVGVTITASASSLTETQRLVLRQTIEGYNIADFNWGTSDAKTVTLSFKVRSSVTGTFSGSLRNSAGDRSYPFTYSISSANTWTDISVTIAGETTGSWDITNGEGILVFFSLGVGPDLQGTAGAWASGNYWGASEETQLVNTNGATFYITGVQLEAGSVATPFEHVDYGEMLRRCQRYFQIANMCCSDYGPAGYSTEQRTPFVTEMRASPTAAQGSTGSTAHFNSSSNTLTVADLRHAYASATSSSTGSYSSRFLNWQFSAEL